MTVTVERILVPMDFGPSSEVALYYGKKLAARLGARLYLLHVIEHPAASAAWWSVPPTADLPKVASMHADASFRLGIVLTEAERAQWRAVVDVVVGSPAREIAAYARDNHIDLVVMGTQGRCGFAHAMLGSVAERIIRIAPCPVLTARAIAGPVDIVGAGSDAAVPAPS